MWSGLVIMLVSALGAFVQSLTGFGYAIISIALWTMVRPFKTAAVIEIVTAFFLAAWIAAKNRRQIRFKRVLLPIVFCYIGSPIGVHMMLGGEEELFRRIFGGVLILLAFFFLRWKDNIRVRPTVVSGILTGITSGFIGGLLGVGGPPAALYFLAVSEEKEEYNATLQFYFCLTNVYIFFMHLIAGNVRGDTVSDMIFATAGLFLGMAGARPLYRKMSMGLLKGITYGFMMLVGLYYMIFG